MRIQAGRVSRPRLHALSCRLAGGANQSVLLLLSPSYMLSPPPLLQLILGMLGRNALRGEGRVALQGKGLGDERVAERAELRSGGRRVRAAGR
eukprot:40623-Hanusia_phi.AAC.1